MIVAAALFQWQDWYYSDQPLSLPASFMKPGVELMMKFESATGPGADPYVPYATYQVKTKAGLVKIDSLNSLEPFVQVTTTAQAAEYSWWLTAYENRITFRKPLLLSITPPSHRARSRSYLPTRMWELNVYEGGYMGAVSEKEWKGLHFPEPTYERLPSGSFRVVRPLMSPTGYGIIEAVLAEELIGPKGQYRVVKTASLETPEKAGVRWQLPTYR